MKSLITLSIISLLILFSFRSSISQEKPRLKPPSEFFPAEKVKVLVVGTFHFDYPGLDVINVDEGNKIDVLKEPKKSEVTELVNYIKKFNPNKIAIEAFDEWNATDQLRKYNEGEYRDKRDERYQLALRIASEMNLDTLYSINANSFIDDMHMSDSNFTNKIMADFDLKSDDPFSQKMMIWYQEEQESIPKVNLLDYFKHINSEESHKYGYGFYLTGDFKLDDKRGADILSMWWYNRNLRMFRNIQDMTGDQDDRILVIVGNGHAAVLRQLLESSPQYEFVEFDSLN